MQPTNTEVAIFGGGCFWCTEAVFKMLRGVSKVLPGYSGGAEVVRIEYDPTLVKYETLLTVFFGSHDPTTLNRQGNDVGTQYRSVVFYTTPEQMEITEKIVKGIEGAVTEIVPFDKFYKAESYHEDYYARNKDAPYCQVIINPKLEKVQRKFADLLVDIYK